MSTWNMPPGVTTNDIPGQDVPMTFDNWFDANGYSEEHRAMFAVVWSAALSSARDQLDGEWHWLMDEIDA